MYTLVMASLMITGGKVGEILGRKRAFTIGCVIYACGSMTTALSPNLTVLMIGWSGLEGLGAVLIMPAIVALVASNFGKPERPRAYGLVAAAGAIAAALGPLIGGVFTTYASWRWVFAGEVLIVAVILLLARRVKDTPGRGGRRARPRRHGAVGAGPGADRVRHPEVRYLGRRAAQAGGPAVARPLAGDLADPGRRRWCWRCSCAGRRCASGAERARLIDPTLLRNVQLRSGVVSFLFMFLVQAGIFFVVPLFLSVALGLSAVETGVRLLPLSLTLLLFAAGVPKLLPGRQSRGGSSRGVRAAVRRPGAARRAAGRRRRAGGHHGAAAARRRRDSARWPRSWAA